MAHSHRCTSKILSLHLQNADLNPCHAVTSLLLPPRTIGSLIFDEHDWIIRKQSRLSKTNLNVGLWGAVQQIVQNQNLRKKQTA